MAQQRRGGRKRRKVDYLAANHIEHVDYKDLELLKRFIIHRGDFISSDRECVAFVLTLEKYI